MPLQERPKRWLSTGGHAGGLQVLVRFAGDGRALNLAPFSVTGCLLSPPPRSRVEITASLLKIRIPPGVL